MKTLLGALLAALAFLPAAAGAFCVSVGWGINAFSQCKSDDGHHESITKSALRASFERSRLDEIIHGIRCRDVTEETDLACSDYGNQWGKVESYDPKYHFDNCAFETGFQDLAGWYGAILREIAKDSSQGATFARRIFGFLVLHRVQDFFSHSNWILLPEHRTHHPLQGRPLLWNAQWKLLELYRAGKLVSGLHKDPENILVADYCKRGGPRWGHASLNKDKATTASGKLAYSTAQTMFQKAYELAAQETQAWWGLIRGTICQRHGAARGAALLTRVTGLRTSCP